VHATARLARLIREHAPCVVLTGAGVSTESGIPDFRSVTGVWAQFDPAVYASIGTFRRRPELIWEFYGPRYRLLTKAEPNAAHHALAALERLGLVDALVTQNVDMLHERAGSHALVEVHGSLRTASCPRCRTRVGVADLLPLIDQHGAPPCPSCAAVLKPDVVMFGEAMPEAEIERAYALAARAGLLLVVGSSLQVWPVADLPGETLRRGGQVAIVNIGETPYDRRAEPKIEAPAGETLATVLAELDGSGGAGKPSSETG
jgi:NAD-dependent deacetylase